MENEISKEELEKIFSKKMERGFFIDSYEFFFQDSHFSFYTAFIDNNYLSDETDILTQVMDLSINIDYYNEKALERMWALYPKKKWRYRLTLLDYLYFFEPETPGDFYLTVNKEILQKSRDTLVSFQACANLCLKEEAYLEKLLKLLNAGGKESNSYVYYRVFYLMNDMMNVGMKKEIKDYVEKMLVEYGALFPPAQKDYFLSRLKRICVYEV